MQFLKSIIQESKSIYKRGVKFVNDRETLTKEAWRLNGDAEGLLKGGKKMIADFRSNAKELGISPDSVKELQQAEEALGVMNTISKQTEGYTKIR